MKLFYANMEEKSRKLFVEKAKQAMQGFLSNQKKCQQHDDSHVHCLHAKQWLTKYETAKKARHADYKHHDIERRYRQAKRSQHEEARKRQQ